MTEKENGWKRRPSKLENGISKGINYGKRFQPNDAITADDINEVVEHALYAADTSNDAKRVAETSATSASNSEDFLRQALAIIESGGNDYDATAILKILSTMTPTQVQQFHEHVKLRAATDGQIEAFRTTVVNPHIVNVNNPHGVTALQVGARPNTWLPTSEEIGAVSSNTFQAFPNGVRIFLYTGGGNITNISQIPGCRVGDIIVHGTAATTTGNWIFNSGRNRGTPVRVISPTAGTVIPGTFTTGANRYDVTAGNMNNLFGINTAVSIMIAATSPSIQLNNFVFNASGVNVTQMGTSVFNPVLPNARLGRLQGVANTSRWIPMLSGVMSESMVDDFHTRVLIGSNSTIQNGNITLTQSFRNFHALELQVNRATNFNAGSDTLIYHLPVDFVINFLGVGDTAHRANISHSGTGTTRGGFVRLTSDTNLQTVSFDGIRVLRIWGVGRRPR